MPLNKIRNRSLRTALALGCVLTVGVWGEAQEKPVALYKGLGAWHHAISTQNPEAQRYFDQGLTLVYSFNRYEALRSFKKASELDSSAAMPFWGMAMAQGPYVNMDGDPSYDLKAACTFVQAGLRLSKVSEPERAYLRAAASWCPEFRPDAYVEATRRLAGEYPDDPDAQTIYADSLLVRARWRWYDAEGTPAPGVADAESVLQRVIFRWPQHPAANHLFIHAVESSPSPERGIASAQKLMGLVPWAGHMIHMPGHIWLALGDWEMAAVVNERAATVDREYFQTTHATGGSYEPYYLHNLQFVTYARSMQGHKAQALRANDILVASSSAMSKIMPEMADGFSGFALLIQARFDNWSTILSTVEPNEKMTATRASLSYVRTLALRARGDAAAALQERGRFEQLKSKIPVGIDWGKNKASDVMRLASESLRARLAPNAADACTHWRRAVEIQDHFVYDEPPAWYYPVRESLGACLLQAGKTAEATEVFREGVRRSPRNGRMLFGLWQSLKSAGDRYEAATVRHEFQNAWSGADITLRIEDL